MKKYFKKKISNKKDLLKITFKDFHTKNISFIKEINSYLIELEHKSGFKIIHIKNNDKENLFCISFKTLPYDSTGVFHILEHTVLCGSKKFPVKDPFFSMTRRSLATFMNAMTSPDATFYPASSEIEKDFYNLFNIYIDSVFFPLLKKESFMQEGWRLEISKNKKNLSFKGIVLNEMKGALSSLDERLHQKMMEKLVPALTYSYNYGGDPSEIITLRYEDLTKAHKKYYHPSNAIFFFYGNIDTKKHINFLEKTLPLKTFIKNKRKNNLEIPKQKRFSTPKEFSFGFPCSKKEEDAIAFGFLTCHISNQEDLIALTLLDYILMQTDASPLKYMLLKSKLLKYAESFLDTQMTEIPWIIICKGTSRTHTNKIFKIIIDTLKKIKISKKDLLSAMHNLEFSRTEISSYPYPYGLDLFTRTALLKQHNINPENGIKIKSLFKNLEKKLKTDPTYLKKVIEKYILKNNHLVALTLFPDPLLSKKEELIEKKKLKKLENTITSKEKKDLIEKEKKLKILQKEVKNEKMLPILKIKDIPKTTKNYPLKTLYLKNNKKVYYHNCFTNNILYVDLIFDIPKIKKEDLFYLSLLTSILDEIGAGKRNYIKTLEYISSYIGKIHSYISLNTQVDNPLTCIPSFSIRGKVLYRNSQKLFSLMKDILTYLDFKDKKRIKELISKHFTILSNSLTENASSYSIYQSLESFSSSFFIKNQMYGLPFFENLKGIFKNLEKNIDLIIEKLKDLSNKIFCSPPSLVIVSDKEFFKSLKNKNFFDILEVKNKDLKKDSIEKWGNNFLISKDLSPEGKIISSNVSFNSMAMKTINFLDEDSPYLLIACQIFENQTLHPKIREEKGAYGSSCNFLLDSSCLYFHSYRDPNIFFSIKTFKEAVKKVSEKKFSKKELFEAKLNAIQRIDSPISIGKKAILSFYKKKCKKTLKQQKIFRKKIMKATEKDIQRASKHLLKSFSDAKIVCFASKDLLEKENKKFKKSLSIQSI